jgi:drug/metabolite transporter (DMT)-like permease
MLFLIITIMQNVIISAIFKLFARYDINALQAIAVNYVVCVITGSIYIGHFPITATTMHTDWFPWALFMGSSFMPLFLLMAYCTKVDGITTMTIANKLSLVIPVIFSVFLYHEQLSAIKIAGILMAFPAVYYTTRVREPGNHNKPQGLFIPALLFVSSGLLDTLVNYVQSRFLNAADIQAVYTVHVFATAAVIGIVLVAIAVARGKTELHWRNIVGGVCVGIPNFFSIYYLIRFLNSGFMHSSAAIPVLNIGILVAATFSAVLFFREKLNVARIIGLALSIAAILFIAYGDK